MITKLLQKSNVEFNCKTATQGAHHVIHFI